MDLKRIQAELPPWKVDEFHHAVTHAGKAVGGLCGLVDDADHARAQEGGTYTTPDDYLNVEGMGSAVRKYAADLVACALKMAQTCPSGAFDLEDAVVARVREKNPLGAFPSADPPTVIMVSGGTLAPGALERLRELAAGRLDSVIAFEGADVTLRPDGVMEVAFRPRAAAPHGVDGSAVPWCEWCRSYHTAPADEEQHRALRCRAPYVSP